MKHTTIIVGIELALAATLPAAPATAQNVRSYLSGHGNDANNCRYTTPCHTFTGALAKTNSGGVISILDPAGYSAVTIDKAISIVNEGIGEAGITFVGAGTGITINAGPNDSVILRGISIDGAGLGTTGIQFNTGASLTVENCVVRNVTADGIDFRPTASSNLSVSNSLLADNGNNGINVMLSGSGTVTAVFNRVQANNNGNIGIFLEGDISTGSLKATVYDSVAAHNATGFYAFTAAGHAPTTLMLFHSVAANNNAGLSVSGSGATLRIAHSMVTANTNGWFNTGGVLLSAGDNTIKGNLSSETAPGKYATK
jgi:hypothetical protein